MTTLADLPVAKKLSENLESCRDIIRDLNATLDKLGFREPIDPLAPIDTPITKIAEQFERIGEWSRISRINYAELLKRHPQGDQFRSFLDAPEPGPFEYSNSGLRVLVIGLEEQESDLYTLLETLDAFHPLESAPTRLGEDHPLHPRGSAHVFIVHGQDELNMRRLKDLLRERWFLEPIVLQPRAGRGRTIIEKFEQEAASSGFALVLMTPDDIVSLEEEGKNYAQARPNVIFELGWFCGRIGRDRVCIVSKRGTDIHSDLAGVERIEFDEHVEEAAAKIEAELRAAGLIQGDG